MNRFDGTRAVVTGAASGIGRATVARLVSEGAAVLAVDRSADGLRETIGAVTGPGRVVAHTADVTNERAVVTAVETAAEELGGLDVLVNVAGTHRTTPIEELTVEDLYSLFSVNLVGTALFCREALRHLPEKSGVIVNVASASATQGHPYMTAYSASKGAVLSFSRSLAAEVVGRGIRVVPISPASIATPLTAGNILPAHLDTRYFGRVRSPLGIGTPEQVAGVIALAASPDGGYITGSDVLVDGGAQT